MQVRWLNHKMFYVTILILFNQNMSWWDTCSIFKFYFLDHKKFIITVLDSMKVTDNQRVYFEHFGLSF